MTTGLLTTSAGQSAIIADAAGSAELAITHVAFGDSDGVPYIPSPEQTDLVNERYRATIASMAVVDGALVIDAIVPANTNDASARPSHGFNIAEAGLWGTTGGVPVLIGVAQMGNGYKPPPSTGQASIATFRFKLACANPDTITVVIDPTAQIALGRLVRAGWITVDGVLNAPPATPATGATYVIGTAPTGAWAGFAGRVAQWIGVWSLAEVPLGHIVADRSKAEADPLRYLKHMTATTWTSAMAAEDALGLALRATRAEALAGTNDTDFLTPATGRAMMIGGLNRQVITAAGLTNWVVPTGIYKIGFELWGAGGGSGYAAAGSAASGGAGGAYLEHAIDVTPGQTVAVTVGVGGAAGLVATAATAGGDTTLVYAGTTYTAGGGTGGNSAAAGQAQVSVAGGAPSNNGTVARPGTSGRGGLRFYGGGTTTLWVGGDGGSAPSGGNGGNSGTTGGLAGSVPGGGGGGGASNDGAGKNGAAGARGEVVLRW